jgi:hypothetical protein
MYHCCSARTDILLIGAVDEFVNVPKPVRRMTGFISIDRERETHKRIARIGPRLKPIFRQLLAEHRPIDIQLSHSRP